jgi:type III pantothenate kinase
MELLFDVGNTHTVIGLHVKERQFKTWRTSTKSLETEDELFAQVYTLFQFSGIAIADVQRVGVASVVPPVNYLFVKLGQKYFNTTAVFVNSKVRVFDIGYRVDYPQEIGADRLANVIAAKRDYGDNVIVVDFGTAITIDVLQQGNFTGGAILPGFSTAMRALFSNTAQLPQVELSIPAHHIGTNTIDNIQIGILKITLLGIERLIELISKDTAVPYITVCTGGASKLLHGQTTVFHHYDPDLTLRGIQYFLHYAHRD